MTTYKHKEGTIVEATVLLSFFTNNKKYSTDQKWIKVICRYDDPDCDIKKAAWYHSGISEHKQIKAVIFSRQITIT